MSVGVYKDTCHRVHVEDREHLSGVGSPPPLWNSVIGYKPSCITQTLSYLPSPKSPFHRRITSFTHRLY